MKMTRTSSLPLALFFALLTPAVAQPPLPPLPPNPQAPTLAPVLPLGMQRGTKLEITLTGTNLAGPTGLWTSFPAKVTIPTDANNGKDNTKLRVLLDVAKDAPLGFHSLRLATTRGMSNLRVFCIDDLPQLMETATNHAKNTAQAVPLPCVVVGRADAEVSDYFKVSVKAGQRVSFEVLGRRLGSAFDPQLYIFDARTGNDLPGGHSNDAPGLQTDARLTYTFKDAGDYLIEIRDVTYRGGADYHYRLRIGDFPCATTPYPLAVKRGTRATVHFAGPNVAGVPPVEVTAPTDPAVSVLWLAPKGASGLYGWPVALALSDLTEMVEQEPNNEPAKATRLALPCGVSGRFLEKGDKDFYVFTVKKGQRYVIEAKTLELFSPTEVYMVLKDPKGGQVAETNPAAAPRLDFTAAADGDYSLQVEHLHYWGGPEETYRLTVTPFEPDFDVLVRLDRYDAPASGTFSIPVHVIRRGYTGPLELSVTGSPLLSGQVTVPANQPKAPNVPAATLTITVKGDALSGPLAFAVQGKATIGGKQVVRFASFRNVLNLALANLPYPPPQYETQLALAVRAKPPFTLAAKFSAPQLLAGQSVTATVTATRAAGFTDPIVLGVTGLPPTVKAAPATIAKGQIETRMTLTAAANAKSGPLSVTITGKARFQNIDVSANTAAVSLAVVAAPFDLKIEPALIQIKQGAKVKIKVTATRRAYTGPIPFTLASLPAGVKVEATVPMTILAGQTILEVTLAAAPGAPVGTGKSLRAVATVKEKVTVVSPNVTVSVQKK